MSATQRIGADGVRIGELAALAGTTPRTIRYYEEIGLLEPGIGRAAGQHRLYGEAELERVRELLRLKELLGLSLEELKGVIEAEEARPVLRAEWRDAQEPGRRIEILRQALGHIDRQLALVDRRRGELERLREQLSERRERVVGHLSGLDAGGAD